MTGTGRADAGAPDAVHHGLALDRVRLTDDFWAPRVETIRRTTLEHQFDQLVRSGRLDALRLTWRPGDEPVPHIFWDSDVAKWIEAASYCLASRHDATLDARVDAVIALLGSAQRPDGYLNSYFSNVAPDRVFTDLRDGHELYCAGHLIEAAVAHYECTGKRSLLDVLRRYADLIVARFGTGDGQIPGYDGHPEIELALVRLYRCTGDRRYLESAAYFVDQRGREPYFFSEEAARRRTPGYFGEAFPARDHDPSARQAFREYQQTHLPVRQQTDAVGHCVRAMYLYSAMAEVGSECGDAALLEACRRLWNSVVSRRMYVTGGIGSSRLNEGWTEDYDLPNDTAYAETCAAIGVVLWGVRMARIEDDARYLDVAERALYNGVLSGMSVHGNEFFYENPLASDGHHHRQQWFGVACCPPNLSRLLASLARYVYSVDARGVRIDLFVASEAQTQLAGVETRVKQSSEYPWSGRTVIDIDPERPVYATVSIRIPEWAQGSATLFLNDQEQELAPSIQRGFARISREWCPGDRLVLDLPLQPQRIRAHPRVSAAAGRVAIVRGPLVYCVEGVDNVDPVERILLPVGAELEEETVNDDVLGTIVSVVAAGERAIGDESPLYVRSPIRTVGHRVAAIPYHLWDNRSGSTMSVWMRSGEPTASLQPTSREAAS
jgi:DUF1680 family protein